MVSKGFDPDEFESHGSTWQLKKREKQKRIMKSLIMKINQNKTKRERERERELKFT
jgi:hypothetical protein